MAMTYPRTASPGARRRSRLAVAVTAVLGLALLVALLFSLSPPPYSGSGGTGDGGGSGRQDGKGDNPYAERFDRGPGAGAAAAGPGQGSANAAADAAVGNSGTNPAATASSAPEPNPEPIPDTLPVETPGLPAPPPPPETPPAMASPPPRPGTPPVADVPAITPVDEPTPAPTSAFASGPFGQRSAGKRGGARARDQGMSADSEAAVERGLKWLAKVQTENGSWEMEAHPVGETALALLAFLGAGYTHKNGRYQSTVRRGLDFLRSQLTGGRFNEGTFYSQGVATMVLCEVYGMTRDGSFKKPAEEALKCVFENCGPNGGYGYDGPGDDTHVTSFQVMAYKAGVLAGLRQTEAAPWRERVLAYYQRALAADGTTGYTSAGGGGQRSLGEVARPSAEGVRGSPTGTRTAAGLFARMFLGCSPDDREVQKIAKVLDQAGPQVGNPFQVYDGLYGMFQVGGSHWKEWNRKCRDEVIKLQVKEGDDAGSWPELGAGMRGGKVVATAFYLMSLEVYYRYLPVNRK